MDAGELVSIGSGVNRRTRGKGGFLKSLGRAVLGRQSFSQSFFVASAQGDKAPPAPELPGDMMLIELRNQRLMIQAGSYVASENGVELTAKVSVKAFMSTEGISMLEASGTGKLLVSSYGAIFERQIGSGEKYIVDTSYLVAFAAGSYQLDRLTSVQNRNREFVNLVSRFRGTGLPMEILLAFFCGQGASEALLGECDQIFDPEEVNTTGSIATCSSQL